MFHTSKVIAWSERIYRQLLKFYPAEFRCYYAAEMTRTFHDLSQESVKRDGIYGLLDLWLKTLGDLIVSVFTEIANALCRKLKKNLYRMLPEDIMKRNPNNIAVSSGLFYGGVLGILLSIGLLIGNFTFPNGFFNILISGYIYSVLIILCVWTGFRGAKATGDLNLGILAGVLAGCVSMLIANIVLDAVSVVFFDYLSQHALQDSGFLQSGAKDYGTYLLNDNLGALFFGTAFTTILGGVLGTLGAFLGKNSSRRPNQF